MKVDPEAWPVLSRLMDEWLDLPPEQRQDWLAHLGPQYASLLPALRELLSTPKPGFLETLPPIDHIPDVPPPSDFAEGCAVGPYRLVRELGHGGMGVVWLAVRSDGNLNREVAIKFPHLHLHSRRLADRFTRERDILSRLSDARIARLYDAGMTPQGQPYLVLEYVEGEAITSYCDRLCLAIRARLRLFLEVLRAVQYAHTNLIVHRDLKPSNILVTRFGEVRLLDFGIAKLLEEGEAQETEITRFGGRALTPDFASPEQLNGDVVTTASDVYSLGVLLYELLTGSRPYKLRENTSGLAQSLLATTPAPPSKASKEALQAAARGASVKRLDAELRGDLDTIVLKALHKEPQARYATADAFAQDIERHLNGQPVLARPESAWYRARKFVARNKLAVASSAAAALVMTIGAGVAIWQERRALQERNRADIQAASARAVSDFLQKDLLAQAGARNGSVPGVSFDPDIKVRTALDRAAARVAGKFDSQPALEAAIRQTIGDTYVDLGLYGPAAQQMEGALELRSRVLGAADPLTLTSQAHLAEVYRADAKYAKAESMLSALLEAERRLHREDAPEALAGQASLAELALEWHGDLARAEALYSSLLQTEGRVLSESDALRLETMNNLAAVYQRESKFAQGEELYRKVVGVERRVLGPDHPNTLASVNGFGVLYMREGKYAEAEAQFETALEGGRRIRGEDHRETLSTMISLGQLYTTEGKYAKAEEILTRACDTMRRVLGDEKPETRNAMAFLADLYRRENRLKEAEALLGDLIAVERRVYGPDRPSGRSALLMLGRVKFQQGAYADAEPPLRQAVAGYRNADTWGRYWAQSLLGADLVKEGKHAEGKPLLEIGYQELLKRQSAIPPDYRPLLDLVRQWAQSESASR